MNINFDKPVIYQKSDYETEHTFTQEEFSLIVNKFMRTELGHMSDLSMLFSNLTEQAEHYYYERSSCPIQRYIDKEIEGKTASQPTKFQIFFAQQQAELKSN